MLTSAAVAAGDGLFEDAMPILAPLESAGCPSFDALVSTHTALVQRLASQYFRDSPPSVELGDLMQIGMIGLWEAAQRYRNNASCNFTSFAIYRIRAAMVDALRKLHWIPRTTMRALRDIDGARAEIEGPNGEDSSAARIAEALGIPVETYHRTMWNVHTATNVSLDPGGTLGHGTSVPEPVDSTPRPDESLEREQMMRTLSDAIMGLPESERAILLLYYDEELLLREIGEALHLSESRVCQIQKKTLRKLKESVIGNAGSAARPREKASMATQGGPPRQKVPAWG